MSGRFVRASSYRHVHGKVPKPEHEFHDLKPTFAGDGNHIAASDKFFAYSGTGGGGPVVVWPLSKTGRLPLQTPMLTVHKDVVLDYDFSPFSSNLIATGGEDLVVKVSSIPDDGLKAHQSESLVTLEGHERKVNIIHWHPTASNVLGTSSSDNSIQIWDVEKGSSAYSFTDVADLVHSFEWNSDGSLLASSSKDLSLRVFDPRNAKSVIKGTAFTGPKVSRVQWRGDKGQIIAVGCSKSSSRQYGIWDLKMMNQPLTVVDIDTSAGILIPYFDPDTGMLYAAGKGDGNIRYWEVVDTDPYVHFLSEFRDNTSQKGICFLPKRACDAKQCEVASALRLLKDKVVPISFQVPRKSADTFQKDLYPEAYGGIPSLSASEWFSGKNSPPKKISMDWKDKSKTATSSSVASSSSVPTSLKAVKSAAQLQSELDTANARIADLEAQLAKLKAK